MTIGKKLMGGSVIVVALTVVMSLFSLYTAGSLGSALSHTASTTGRSLELAGEIASNASDMFSEERGLLLRLALGDTEKAGKLHTEFGSSADKVQKGIDQIKPLLDSKGGQGEALSAALASWLPADAAMWKLCSNQDYQGAFKIFDEKVAPWP